MKEKENNDHITGIQLPDLLYFLLELLDAPFAMDRINVLLLELGSLHTCGMMW